MLNQDDLQEFLNDQKENLLEYDTFEVSLTVLTKYASEPIKLTGPYKQGLDVNHGSTITFTRIIDGYKIDIILWEWELEDGYITAVSGKVAIGLSDLETMLIVFKLNQAQKSITKSIIALIVLSCIGLMTIPLVSTFKMILGAYKFVIYAVIILGFVFSIVILIRQKRTIDKIKPWLDHNDLLN